MEIQAIFLSYSRTDSEFVFKLTTDLKNVGVNVWLDQKDIRSGTHFDTEIQKAIQLAKCIVVILSPKSVSSNNVLDEVAYALDEGKKIIPIMLVDCAVPLRLRRMQHIDFRRNYDIGLKNLLNELNTKIPDTIIPQRMIHKNFSLIKIFIFGITLIAIIIFFISNHFQNDNKESPPALTTDNQRILSDSTAYDSNRNESISANPTNPSKEVASNKDAGKGDELLQKSKNAKKRQRSVLIKKPVEADNSIPEIISWKIYDKNSKKSYTDQIEVGSIIVDSEVELEISVTVQDPQGVKKVDIFGDVGIKCIKPGSNKSNNFHITGQLWDYTRSDNQVYTEVVTVLGVNIKEIFTRACSEGDSYLDFNTGHIKVYCQAYNYLDAARSEELYIQFLKINDSDL